MLRDYQRDFERLANYRVVGWPQKALVVTFLGGLKDEIVDADLMFKPRTLHDAFELVHMKDDTINKQRKPQ